ncbi:MAG: ABC transporter permease [Sphingomonas sp.]|nr:ABC transporter permease [Sphingomonas sp.]
MNEKTPVWTIRPPGDPSLDGINWAGLKTLYAKEVKRFFKVQMQAVWAPAVTALLYFIIFTVAFGRGDREILGVSFADFIGPGLVIMAMIQNSFANASFSLLVGKIQGTIVDYLMPPLSIGELISGLVAASVTRAFLVGGAVWLVLWLWPDVDMTPVSLWPILLFGFLGSLMLAFFGLMTSLWAEKFDHAAMVTNFVVAPLALLSGTFYSVEALPQAFQTASYANPFFYVISGFRYGFIGAADSNVIFGAGLLTGLNVLLFMGCYALLKSGWKLRS